MRKCEICGKKSRTKLCENCEKYVNQDYKSQRELPTDRDIIEEMYELHQNPHTLSELQSYFAEPSVNFDFLNKLQNKILHLVFFEGKKYSEVSQLLGINKNAVRGNLTRARAKIRATFSTNRKDY